MKHTVIENPAYCQHVAQYGQYLQIMHYAPQTVDASKALLLEFFAYLENRKVYQLPQTPQVIEDFMQYLKKRPNTRLIGKGLSTAHQAKFWQALRNFDRYLRTTQQTTLNMPARTLENIPVHQRDIGQILTMDEVHQLYQVCDTSTPFGLRDRAMLSIFYGCGLRRKEGVSLQVNDIKFTEQLLHVIEGKLGKERYVPMSKQVKEDLSTYLLEARPYLIRATHPTYALLISQRGRRPTGDTLKVRLMHLQQQTENPVLQAKKIGLHLLRHSIATHLLQQGMSLKRIAQFLGHTHLESTQVYTHLTLNTPVK